MIDRERLEAICEEAGQMALRQWPGHGHALESWEKTPGSPVCTADLEVDAYLKRELQALLPSAGWLSRKPSTMPAGSPKACAGWSIRSTARAISFAGGPAGRCRWR